MIECQKKALETLEGRRCSHIAEAIVSVRCDLRDKSFGRHVALLLSKDVSEMAKPTIDEMKAALLWKLCKGCPMLRQEDEHES